MQRRLRERHQIRYDNRQMGLLIAGALVAVVVVFTLGVLSGRYLLGSPGETSGAGQAPAASAPDRPAKKETRPPAPGLAKPKQPVPREKDRFTFYRSLSRKEKLPPPLAVSPPPKPKAPVSKEGTYAIQVGAYRQRADARNVAASLKAKGYPAYVETYSTRDKGTWYRVRIGPYPTREEAEAQARAYERREGRKPLLIKP